MKRLTLVLACLVLAVSAWAVQPATDQYVPSVGHGSGVCVDGICAEWRTTAWIFNPSSTASASVQITFLRRDTDNSGAAPKQVSVAPGETLELADIIGTLFELDNAYGALRFVADIPVVVTGTTFDANVHTAKESCTAVGTAGQFFSATPAANAIGAGESVELVGLAQDAAGMWRSNFGFVETTGNTCRVEVQPLDADGLPVGKVWTYVLRPRDAQQPLLSQLAGVIGPDLRLHVRVVDGSGKIVAAAFRIDNTTGDPFTIEMVGAGRDGSYLGRLVKTTYDTPLTLTIAGGAITDLGATVIFTDEDVASCRGELLRVAGPLPQPVLLESDGSFSFSVGSTIDGVGVSVSVEGAISSAGSLNGTVTTTLTDAGSCSGSKAWPLVGARLP